MLGIHRPSYENIGGFAIGKAKNADVQGWHGKDF